MSVSPFRFSGDAGRESLRAIAASLEERGIPAARQRGVRIMLGVPLLRDGSPVGVIILVARIGLLRPA
jgi:hypothetical protein